MSNNLKISFARSARTAGGLAVILAAEKGALTDAVRALDPQNVLETAFRVAGFTGKRFSTVDVLAPAGSDFDRFLVVGLGEAGKLDAQAWLRIGGVVAANLKKADKAAVHLDAPGVEVSGTDAAELALGLLLRSYRFDRYKTKKPENGDADLPKSVSVTILGEAAAAAKKAFTSVTAVAGGVTLARDLVNEPANILGPVEFAAKVKELEDLGVEVEILTEKELRKLGAGALLGVAQGSVRPPRLAVMHWKGGKAGAAPLAFVGKGVVFDTGGISIKPAGGMEDMKGDMGGAAAVTGLFHTLAARKAKVNAVGVVGLVENMVDGNAQRPGDIVTSLSGQTIEVLNTDAEGRLVLADALTYTIERFEPRFTIDLATLTGAVIVALGNHHAGLFSNEDELAQHLTQAGIDTGEKVWRLPLGSEYDKLIDSKNADVKNIGGRAAGSVTAAQFLQRFVKDTPWAHLDIAGTAMGSPASDINRSWASGFGVRLLDRLVRDHYEG